jgi:PadR family transcriptional regulator, regulatory protein PadR
MPLVDTPISTRTAVLQALISGEAYGLELIDRIKTRSKGAVVVRQGSLYPALAALEDERLVKSWDGEPMPERGGRPRRYYQLTAKGQRAALETQEALVGFFGALLPEAAR